MNDIWNTKQNFFRRDVDFVKLVRTRIPAEKGVRRAAEFVEAKTARGWKAARIRENNKKFKESPFCFINRKNY